MALLTTPRSPLQVELCRVGTVLPARLDVLAAQGADFTATDPGAPEGFTVRRARAIVLTYLHVLFIASASVFVQ